MLVWHFEIPSSNKNHLNGDISILLKLKGSRRLLYESVSKKKKNAVQLVFGVSDIHNINLVYKCKRWRMGEIFPIKNYLFFVLTSTITGLQTLMSKPTVFFVPYCTSCLKCSVNTEIPLRSFCLFKGFLPKICSDWSTIVKSEAVLKQYLCYMVFCFCVLSH